MGNDNFNSGENPTQDLRIQVEVLKTEYKNEQNKVYLKEQELATALTERNRLKTDLAQASEKLIRLERDLDITKERLQNTVASLTEQNKKKIIKTKNTKILAVIATILFLLASLLLNYGNSLMTSNPPNITGIFVLSVATIMYILAALINILVIGGNL